MKLLIISSNVFSLPPSGYSGLEVLAYLLATGLAEKGHQVSIVCPEGSKLPEGIEGIFCPLREEEEKTWQRYKGRLENGEWPLVVDASWQRWATMSVAGKDPPPALLIQWHHSDPSVYSSPGPLRYPMWVGLSQDHADRLSKHLRVPVRFVYNSIDTSFYRANGQPRSNRYLWLGRYTIEKSPLDIMNLARNMKIGLDCFGDTEIVSDQGYVERCRMEADGLMVRWSPGISREQTVHEYSTHKALLYWPLWSEPLGLTILEAQACGTVPIVRKSGALPELIKHGETGFLVESLDQMRELIDKDAVKEIDLEVMRKHVEDKFSLERFVADWETLLRRVAEGGERW